MLHEPSAEGYNGRMQMLKLAFVTSAFNEALNLYELHRRCRAVYGRLLNELNNQYSLEFRMVIADNHSTDSTLEVLRSIMEHDPGVIVLANQINYGPEASAAHALTYACDCDLVITLCSDLQDPPELSEGMVMMLMSDPNSDAVLAVKQQSAGGPLLRLARRGYYRAMGMSSRLRYLPSGFHGFGCYRNPVIIDTLHYWNDSGMSLRMCIVNASHASRTLSYQQAERMHGHSSYIGRGYILEALRALLSSDAAASRMAVTIGIGGMLMAMLVAVVLLINYLGGNSQYQGGVPTVMGLVLASLGIQMLMFAVVSRQIEGLRMTGNRSRVRARLLKKSDDA
ncbi:glycosyltransferase [Cyanobium sp. Morenito 9A2]|uniref:glycosyltransferase n=1 Tax=Cyanobium sp. Morenito 9A2 TaxID=2823718 RepID=UPI0020CEB327|nr:glycosyltransferase [Cyanobium sp. Morenito 9A2]MCP9848786.1 glycosyltransferase [Cyanobium sp. Morenito 9A2]